MGSQTSDFVKTEMLKVERRLFFGKIISIVIGYAGITFWLNAIRATWPIWLVWVLIIVQLILYFSIFISSYNRALAIGLNKTLGFVIFVALAVLGRVNDWELVIIPLLFVVMLVASAKNKNIANIEFASNENTNSSLNPQPAEDTEDEEDDEMYTFCPVCRKKLVWKKTSSLPDLCQYCGTKLK